ncbi:MAG: hypothetical protein JWR18_278 [Segetibacter sp.]|nr:hypothetical protein [Segetibacter sp.]
MFANSQHIQGFLLKHQNGIICVKKEINKKRTYHLTDHTSCLFIYRM